MVVKYKLRLYLFALLILAGFYLLGKQLWTMQMVDHEEYAKKVPGTKELRIRIPGVRGEIKDRNGVTLVTNRASFDIIFDLRDIVADYRSKLEKGESLPRHKYVTTVGGLKRERNDIDIVKIVNEGAHASLEELGLAGSYSATQLRSHYLTNSGYIPWTYRRDLSYEEFATLAERNLNLPGVSVAARPQREYRWGSLACHILGYVKQHDEGMITAEERKEWDFYVGDEFGIAGVESIHDADLRGRPGSRTILKDEKGQYKGEVGYEAPRQGADVYLSLDLRVQYIVEQTLREAGIGRGSAVVMDPRNGDILGLASVPSFTPAKYIPRIKQEDLDDYNNNPVRPLVNGAIQGYAPGSTYKIPIALAGCVANVDGRWFNCAGGVQYGNKFMRCWIHNLGGRHNSIGLSEAIMRSCNAYFYQFGNAAGIRNIVKTGNDLGLGQSSGIGLEGENPGILPGPEWMKRNQPGYKWTSSYTANTAIGQGYVLASPLQMTSVTCTVANGGKSFAPRLIDRVRESDGSNLVRKAIVLRSDLTEEGISPTQIERVRRGMWKVVNEKTGSTGWRAKIEGVDVAGKTGTAQFFRMVDGVKEKDNHTWFISFAPYDAPTIAVTAFVRGGKAGGSTAAPIARRIIERTLAMQAGTYRVDPKPTEEVRGNFDPVELVDFGDTPDIAPEGAELAEVEAAGGIAPARETIEAAPAVPRATPSIEPDASGEEIVVPRAIPIGDRPYSPPRARPVTE